MAEADVTNEPSNMAQVEYDDGSPLVDPSILKHKRVMLVRDLDVETVMVGMKPVLVHQFSNMNAINAEPDCGKKTGMLIDFLQRYSVKEYGKFNTFMKIIGGTQPDLFCALVGRAPTETEVDFCVQTYAETLKKCINGQGHSVDSPFDEEIEFESQHVQLAISRDKPDSETFDDLPHRYQAHLRNVEERTDHVPAVEVLASAENEKKPKRLSMYGRAGTGKSTTFQWLAREWSFSRWAADVTLIFLLQVRLLSICDYQITAIELLTLYSLYQVQETDLVCLMSSWLKHSGAKVIILLDGLDEISCFSTRVKNCRKITNLKQKAHPIDICINILLGNLLPGSTVLTASRSFAGLTCLQFDRQFEILGLTESRVIELVERKHPTKAAHITSVLRSNPLLMSISGITFYCVLISRLLADGVVFDNEELQTYTRLTAFIIVQYVSRKLSDWPFVVEVRPYFSELACLAYNGIFQEQENEQVSKLVFDEYDLSKAELTTERLKSVLQVGLLQTKKLQIGARSSVVAEFIHLSVQEMMASIYLLSHFPLSDNIFSRQFSGDQFNMALLYSFGLQYDSGSNWIKDIRHSVSTSGEDLSPTVVKQMDSFIDTQCENCGTQKGFTSQLQLCQLLYEGQMEDKAKGVVRYIVPDGKLVIVNTQMTLIDLMAVWFVCEYAEAITEISLRACGLTDGLVKFMTSSLMKVNAEKLLVLDLVGNNIGPGGTQAIAEWLKENHTLHTLSLEGNKVGEDGATAIAALLQNNKTLQTLNLHGGSPMYGGNHVIGNTGATAIAAALQKNTSLHTLDIGRNNIRDVGARDVARLLQTNRTLQTLDVGDNSIGDFGFQAIATALMTNRTLKTLNIRGSIPHPKTGETGARRLATGLQHSALQYLDISGNAIGNNGAKALAETLQSNRTLQTLNVSCNNIGDKELKELQSKGHPVCRIKSDFQIGHPPLFPSVFRKPVYLDGFARAAFMHHMSTLNKAYENL